MCAAGVELSGTPNSELQRRLLNHLVYRYLLWLHVYRGTSEQLSQPDEAVDVTTSEKVAQCVPCAAFLAVFSERNFLCSSSCFHNLQLHLRFRVFNSRRSIGPKVQLMWCFCFDGWERQFVTEYLRLKLVHFCWRMTAQFSQ